MRQLIVIFLVLSTFFCSAQSKSAHDPRIFKMPPAEGTTDSYTVKQYYFVMLVKGPKRNDITDTNVINKLQDGHMANISRLVKGGKLLVAGPFGDDINWRGIFIFDCDTEQEVEQLLATDPMIKAGRLGYEIHPWWTGMNSVFK